jgi:8-oxo-dGTP pyrophosphatase MutT (NUDIX family)
LLPLRRRIKMDYVMGLRKVVGNRPLILTGACVLIINNKNELLLQHRSDGGWGLPGGLMELGEFGRCRKKRSKRGNRAYYW